MNNIKNEIFFIIYLIIFESDTLNPTYTKPQLKNVSKIKRIAFFILVNIVKL